MPADPTQHQQWCIVHLLFWLEVHLSASVIIFNNNKIISSSSGQTNTKSRHSRKLIDVSRHIMEDYKSEIDILLDGLDKSVNSNTAWLHFGINSAKNFELRKFLVNQLRTGFFHFALCENDINRGWEHYVSIGHSKNWKDTMIMLQKPGNTWNGNENLTIEEITQDKAKEFIIDLLTGEQKYFSKSSLGTPFDKQTSSLIFDNFVKHIKGSKDRQVIFYNIKTDFLSTVEDYYNSDYTTLGYFENSGRDFALGILLYEKEMETLDLKILLTNGYS